MGADHHLLPWFGTYRLNEITKCEFDRFRDAKTAEGVLSNRITNKALTRLAQVLADAVEYDLTPSNLLVASDKLFHDRGRPLVATPSGAGLRIEELLGRRWADAARPTSATTR